MLMESWNWSVLKGLEVKLLNDEAEPINLETADFYVEDEAVPAIGRVNLQPGKECFLTIGYSRQEDKPRRLRIALSSKSYVFTIPTASGESLIGSN